MVVAGEVHRLLRALRHPTKDRLVWLDSICIDQKNKDEKSWQIGFMKDIYSSAEQVIGWIAVMPEIPYLPGPFSCLRKLGKLSESSESSEEIFRWYLHGDLCFHLRAAIITLCNEFFFRTWIIQEVALAQKLILKFDSEEIAWEDFVDTVRSFLLMYTFYASIANFGTIIYSRIVEAMEKINILDEFRTTFQITLQTTPEGLPLSRLLLGSVDFHVTVSRDRVFGILGLSTESARTAVPIRYDSATTDQMIMINASKFALSKESSFRLLELGGVGYLPSEFASKLDGPSWISWWESPIISVLKLNTATCKKLHRTATWAPVGITRGDYTSSVLRLEGINIDKIRLLSHPWFALDQILAANYTTIEGMFQLYSGLHELIEESFRVVQHAHHPTYNDTDRRNLVWRTICHDSRKGERDEDLQSYEEDAKQVENSIRAVRDQLQKLIERGNKKTGMGALEGLGISSLAGLRHLCPMQTARLCITDSGYFGVVPAYAREGDEIWAILGGANPFVLRVSSGLAESEVTNAHELVGVCYIDGIMQGELENVGLKPTQTSLV